MRLADKNIIVTGGGSGLGRAASLLFVREGANVVIAERSQNSGEQAVSAIKERGGEAIFIRTDVTNANEVKNLIEMSIAKFSKIDVLYNNAGVAQEHAFIEDIDVALWNEVYAQNVKSVFLTVKHVVPYMKQAKAGVIINTSSLLAVRTMPKIAAYASSKGAVIAITRQLALELAPFNIRVNCINPTAIDTPLLRRLVVGQGWENFRKSVIENTPLSKMVSPEDVAYTALYLASDESKMVTGTCINIDGGRAV